MIDRRVQLGERVVTTFVDAFSIELSATEVA